MNSTFIRFVKNKTHLLSDIEDGFVLQEHPIKFRPSIFSILPSLISLWAEKGLSSTVIQPILNKHKELDEKEFWEWLTKELEENQIFNLNLSYMTTQINSAKIKMKCFTELRDNQKIHPNHRYWFGDYGISLTKEWMHNNNGDRIVYVDSKSELTNRIARVTSMLLSTLDGKDVITAVFDILSFTEIEDNSHEYEWRIVGNHNFAGKSYGNYPEKITFSNDDIVAIYLKQNSDIAYFSKILKEKKKNEGSRSIPQIYLTDEIFLTEGELEEIEAIHTRVRK